jgi:hypothetical protein
MLSFSPPWLGGGVECSKDILQLGHFSEQNNELEDRTISTLPSYGYVQSITKVKVI